MRHFRAAGWLPWVARVGTFATLMVCWEVFARIRGGLLLPPFSRTAVAFVDLMRGPLPAALWVSNQAMLAGFALAMVTGIPLGLLLGRLRTLERIVEVYLSIMLVTPMAAVIPLKAQDPALIPDITRTFVERNIWPLDGGFTPEIIDRTIQFYVSAGTLKPGLRGDQIGDYSLVRAVLKEIGK